MRLPKGWKENDECVMVFLKAKRKMKEILGTASSTASTTPPLPETASDQPVLARHDPMRLGNFLYKARFFLEKDENKGRNFFALGKALVACGAARACKNFDDKDDFQVINERSVRLALVQWCRDEQYGLQHFRYAH